MKTSAAKRLLSTPHSHAESASPRHGGRPTPPHPAPLAIVKLSASTTVILLSKYGTSCDTVLAEPATPAWSSATAKRSRRHAISGADWHWSERQREWRGEGGGWLKTAAAWVAVAQREWRGEGGS